MILQNSLKYEIMEHDKKLAEFFMMYSIMWKTNSKFSIPIYQWWNISNSCIHIRIHMNLTAISLSAP